MDTPVLLLLFNRPDLTKRVFSQVEKARPRQIFIAADGPRKGRVGENEKCEQTRRMALDRVSWDCEVHTLFREENLGCKKAVSSAIDWFFSSVDRGIILEDDCLPDPSFFHFCTELLARYEHNEKVMHISGNNFQDKDVAGGSSYYFSVYNHIWGWATWRRAWQAYDVMMKEYDPNVVRRLFRRKRDQEYWQECFTKVIQGETDTWDYQWTYAIWKNEGVSILPCTNLVSNIGFREDATHTTTAESITANLPISTLGEIVHPKKLHINEKADLYTSQRLFVQERLSRKRTKLKRIILSETKSIASLISMIISNTKHRLKEIVDADFRVSWREHQRLIQLPRYTQTRTPFLGAEITVPDAASFLFMRKEIFEQQVYRFEADTDAPYILDCGANIGLSIIYFKKMFPNAKVIGFEPDEKIFSILEKNLAAVKLNDVTLEKRAVWSSKTTLTFLEEGADGGRISSQQNTSSSKKVLTVRLKDYLDRPIDFLKIDIEGAETEVVLDCEDRLHYVKNMFIEYHSFTNQEQLLDEMLSVIRRSGFRYYINTPGLSSAQPFVKINESLGMDMQLNVYCVR